MTEPTPRTEAGRLLLARLEWSAQRHEVEPSSALDLAQRSILAIEAEAAAQARTEALDVEALRKQTPRGNFDVGWNAALDAILAAKETGS